MLLTLKPQQLVSIIIALESEPEREPSNSLMSMVVGWVRMSGSPRSMMFGSRWFLWAVHLETRVLEPYQSSVDLLVCPALVF